MTNNEQFINSSSNTFNETQRNALKSLSNVGDGNTYLKDNKPLEDYIQTLRDMHPEKFHRTKEDLMQRVFFDTPTSMHISYKRAVRPRMNSPYLTKEAK
jgi:hypothetical protein